MKTILIVDDDKTNLTAARSVLSDDYKVIAVTKGSQALKYLEKENCDLILLDINMPEMDGFAVLSLLKEDEKTKDIPVIFLTADNDSETEIRCIEIGAMDFIVKPFVPKVMQFRISKALELAEFRKQKL